MKSIVADNSLSQLLIDRMDFEKASCFFLDDTAHPFGINIISIQTQSIALPNKTERVMDSLAESEKRSETEVIDAKNNLESAKIFREASDELIKIPRSL